MNYRLFAATLKPNLAGRCKLAVGNSSRLVAGKGGGSGGRGGGEFQLRHKRDGLRNWMETGMESAEGK